MEGIYVNFGTQCYAYHAAVRLSLIKIKFDLKC